MTAITLILCLAIVVIFNRSAKRPGDRRRHDKLHKRLSVLVTDDRRQAH